MKSLNCLFRLFSSHRGRRPRRESSEAGYILLIVMMMATLLLVSLAAAVPSIYVEGQREKEKELIFRGEQYARAIILFHQQFKRYPTSVKELLHTNNLSYLRHAYPDPMTRSGKWRFIHATANGVVLDSKILKPPGMNQNKPFGSDNGKSGSPSGSVGTQTSQPATRKGSQQGSFSAGSFSLPGLNRIPARTGSRKTVLPSLVTTKPKAPSSWESPAPATTSRSAFLTSGPSMTNGSSWGSRAVPERPTSWGRALSLESERRRGSRPLAFRVPIRIPAAVSPGPQPVLPALAARLIFGGARTHDGWRHRGESPSFVFPTRATSFRVALPPRAQPQLRRSFPLAPMPSLDPCQYHQPISIPLAQPQFLFSHPPSFVHSHRNFLLCSYRNFSLCSDTRRDFT